MVNCKEIIERYLYEFYTSIIEERAIIAIEDGLKPIQRKLLYSFWEDGRSSNKPFTKSVISAGSVLKYSPHGDASAYDSAVNMSCYMNNIPLLTMHGGNRSIYGLKASKPRYTELRLSKFSEDVLLDKIDKKYNSVDYMLNFDESREEPAVLPSKIPNFLLNGNIGIVGGFMSSILPHSLNLICDKTIQYIKNPTIDLNEFIKDLVPSFPTGGTIINTDAVKQSYTIPSNIKNKSSGVCILRGKVKYDEKKNYISIYEIPYYSTTEKILEQIKEIIKKGNLQEIKSIKNLSADGLIDIRLYLKNGVDENAVIGKLYKLTGLQDSIPIVNIMLHKGKLKIYNDVKEMLADWLEFRINTIKRISNNQIKDLNYQKHIKEGLEIVCSNPKNIDILLSIVRNPKLTEEQIYNKVQKQFDLSSKQTEYILSTKIVKLSTVSIKTLQQEISDLKKEIQSIIKFISNENNIKKRIIEELTEIKKKYGKLLYNFETEYENINMENNIEDTIADENFVLMLTKQNYLKKIKTTNIKTQKRSGMGSSVGKLKDGDCPMNITLANSKDWIFLFTENGYMFRYKCYDLPATENINNLGKLITGLTNNTKIVSMIAVSDEELKSDNSGLLILTSQGRFKITMLSDFNSNFKSIIAAKLAEDDIILNVYKVDTTKPSDILVSSTDGHVARINIEEVPILSRVTQGSLAFNYKFREKGRKVLGCEIITSEDEELLFIYSNGLAKRCKLDQFPIVNRGSLGVLTGIREGSELVKCLSYSDDNDVVSVISKKKNITVKLNEIPITKRQAYGSILQKFNDDEIVDAVILDSNNIK